MKLFKFTICYFLFVPFYLWPFAIFCCPRIYEKYPDDNSQGEYEMAVYRVYFSNTLVHKSVVSGSLNKAYLKMRCKALEVDWRTHREFGITYGLRKIK